MAGNLKQYLVLAGLFLYFSREVSDAVGTVLHTGHGYEHFARKQDLHTPDINQFLHDLDLSEGR